MADLTSRRRGQVQEVQQLSGTKKEVHAHVPLKELLGYSTDLRSQTKGNASFSMDFDRYELLQPFEQKNVLEKYGYFEFVK
jgi:elongation factor G